MKAQPGVPTSRPGRSAGRRLLVGLVNNMSDGALRPTEAQFCGLIREAAPAGMEVDFRYFSLSEIARGAEARAYMQGRYAPTDELAGAGLDALVVTGAEPRAAAFEEEVYWPDLARLIDWAAAERIPTIWSCLAAHAALWRLHGIPRVRMPLKRYGAFPLDIVAQHSGTANARITAIAPHSRWNDVDRGRIEAARFRTLAYSPNIGVDTFARIADTSSFFFQGHPEYDADTLAREYLRDVSRFLRGQRPSHPQAPSNYFEPATLQTLAGLRARAERAPHPDLSAEYARVLACQQYTAVWRPWAAHVYSLWLGQFGREPLLENACETYIAE